MMIAGLVQSVHARISDNQKEGVESNDGQD